MAPAKLNLFLHVLGRRDDGYHELESLVAFADIGDKGLIESAAEFSCSITGDFAQHLDSENNSLIDAARWTAKRVGRELDVCISLVKNLPVAAGIGGGSSDAAAVIRGLLQHWGAEDQMQGLIAASFELGADVPVCLYGQAAIVRGAGDVFEPFAMGEPLFSVLVNPLVSCSTAAVFGAYQGRDNLSGERNDLQEAAVGIVPEILDVLGSFSGARYARMSGSGATCFGIYETPDAANNAAADIAREHPEWWVRDCVIK